MTPSEPFEPSGPVDPFERALSLALLEEAADVPVSSDAMAKIRERVLDGHRTRFRFARRFDGHVGAVAATLVIALVIAGGVVAVILGGGSPGNGISMAHKDATGISTTPPTSPTGSDMPVDAGPYPADGLYPTTHAISADATAYATPAAVASDWLNALGITIGASPTTVTHLNGDDATIEVLSAPQHPVTAVHLVRWGTAWVVVGASDGTHVLVPTAPATGAVVTSPVVVSGAAYGTDERVAVSVISGTTTVGTASSADFGSGSGRWAAWVPFAASTAHTGAVVVTQTGDAGTVERLDAEPVRFTHNSSTVTTVPSQFFAVTGGGDGIASFDSTSGKLLTQLVSGSGNEPLSDLQEVENTTLYAVRDTGAGSGAQAGAGCDNALVAIDPQTGAVAPVTAAGTGWTITGYAVDSDGSGVALAEEACDDSAYRLLASDPMTERQHVVALSPGVPPVIVGNPSWGQVGQVSMIVKPGNGFELLTVNAFTAADITDSTPESSCGSFNSAADEPDAIAVDGVASVVASQGNADTTQSCGSTAHDFSFDLPDHQAPATISLAGGQAGEDPFTAAVVESDAGGAVWTYDGHTLTRVPVSQPISSPAW